MARRFDDQASSWRHARVSDGTNTVARDVSVSNTDRYRYRNRKTMGGGGGGGDAAAARRWRELRARLRVARALRHSSQGSQGRRPPVPSRPACRNNNNNDNWRSSSLHRPEPTTNNRLLRSAAAGRQAETASQSEMTNTRRSATNRTRYVKTTEWWKSEDRSNWNDPEAPETGNAMIRAPSGHVVDNFRFADADRNRKWVENEEPRYVERNLTRYVRSCRRAKSLDEDSDNDDRRGWCSVSDPRNHTASVKCSSNTPESSEDVARTANVDHVRSSDAERRTLKRSRSQRISDDHDDPLFVGRSVEERRAIGDLLSLDNEEVQSMEVDTDREDGQPVHHEFLKVSRELRQLCISDDDCIARSADLKTVYPSSTSVVDGFQREKSIFLAPQVFNSMFTVHNRLYNRLYNRFTIGCCKACSTAGQRNFPAASVAQLTAFQDVEICVQSRRGSHVTEITPPETVRLRVDR